MNNTQKAVNIAIYGLVQGVGFRPFVYNLATSLDLSGWALNRNDGVQIHVQGKQYQLEEFVKKLRTEAPPLSRIESLHTEEAHPEKLTGFTIRVSQSHSADVTRVSPDVAVCQDCLDDMKRQANRLNYPFVNCTNCGPRFSIIRDLPYDREKTTMQPFVMCRSCQEEYETLTNRRFHAQPNACWDCGPQYELVSEGERIHGNDIILEIVCRLLEQGKIAAIKGIGGFHLACDAANEEAVAALRRRKHREGKPFAVMFRNLESVREYAAVNEAEARLLLSEKRPIVLLNSSQLHKKALAPSVSNGLDSIGVMLPYTPLHYLLFERLVTDALVLTSGNISDEPIVISNEDAEKTLSQVADAILSYNRDIHNRSDDSVVSVVNGTPRLLRRSRGWVPQPVTLHFDVEGIVATGAELKNCFCVGKGRQAILSQHIGDLKNLETYEFYQEAFDRFTRLFRVKPERIACDRHPDYLSTRFAREYGLPCIEVQHHHAHIASCMAEFGLDEQVIGISLDGTGLGDDQQIWGGECLICDLHDYQRFSHFEYVPMPGGDKAAEEPWRMGISYLYRIFGKEFFELDIPFVQTLDKNTVELLLTAIDKGINCPHTSSAGRLFDAVAAIINLVTTNSFEAEAPIRLESRISAVPFHEIYPYRIKERIDVDELIRAIVNDVRQHIPTSVIAARFHNTMSAIILDLAQRMRAETGIHRVVLSGGVFQNRFLLGRTEKILQEHQFSVYSNVQVPANDGGICAGQLAVAAKA